MVTGWQLTFGCLWYSLQKENLNCHEATSTPASCNSGEVWSYVEGQEWAECVSWGYKCC